MYQLLLTNRYLTSRVIPLLAVAAVALCVALVIVVVSVMTGFLDMVKSSGRTLMGDVIVGYPVSGIPYYEDLIQAIEDEDQASAATAVVDTWGILRMPYPDGDAKESKAVQVWGVEPGRFSAVTDYEDNLLWNNTPEQARPWLMADAVVDAAPKLVDMLDTDQKVNIMKEFIGADGTSEADIRLEAESLTREQWIRRLNTLGRFPAILEHVLSPEQLAFVYETEPRLRNDEQVMQDGVEFTRNGRPAIIAGIHVSDGNSRNSEGEYDIARDGYWWLPRFEGVLTTIPIDTRGGLSEPESVILPFANEFSSGIFLIDDSRILVPLSTAQELTHLDEAELVDVDDPTRVVGIDPARATMILVRSAEGVTPDELLPAVERAYATFLKNMKQRAPSDIVIPTPSVNPGLYIQTWEQHQSGFIGPVEKERELMRVLFSIVYAVCAALVLAIFWSIVHEKTRDIGILRSIGASRGGIVGIFLLYGLVVGVLGALLGLGLGWLIVTNLNLIHDGMSEPPMLLGIVLLGIGGSLLIWGLMRIRGETLLPVFLSGLISIPLIAIGAFIVWAASNGVGFIMWDPRVYYFTEIPNTVDMNSALVSMVLAICCSLVGALVPAIKAADTDPVNALRYE
jgi:lipoprotein-releasing system permease protein